MGKEGWILLYKKFQKWQWYDYPTVKIIFLHCLLEANFKDEDWQGQKIKRGQFPTSIEKLATLNGLTLQQTRNALKKLQTTNEINIQTTNRYSIITVKNYDLYQTSNKQKTQSNNKPKSGGCNKQIGGANNNTIKNIKKERDNKLSLSIDEREILKNYLIFCNEKRKNKIDDIDAYIHKLIENGDYLTKLEKAMKWLERKKQKKVIPPPGKIEKSNPEVDKQGLELMRATAQRIRKGENNDKNSNKTKDIR